MSRKLIKSLAAAYINQWDYVVFRSDMKTVINVKEVKLVGTTIHLIDWNDKIYSIGASEAVYLAEKPCTAHNDCDGYGSDCIPF